MSNKTNQQQKPTRLKGVARGRAEVESSACSSQGHGLDSQCLKGSSQAAVTPVPGDPKPSFGLHGHQARTFHADIHTQADHPRTQNFEKKW